METLRFLRIAFSFYVNLLPLMIDQLIAPFAPPQEALGGQDDQLCL